MQLYLVRHSNTRFEPETPNEQWVLSEVGVQRAELLAQHSLLADTELVCTSMQLKAMATGLKIAELLRVPMRPDHDLTELSSITKDFIPNYEEAVTQLYAGQIDRINGGETLDEALQRFNGAIERIISNHRDIGRLAVVSHCNILSLFAAQFDERSAHDLHGIMGMPDVAVLDWETKQFSLPFGSFQLGED
jgi:broad specificity phosphatase PhoE